MKKFLVGLMSIFLLIGGGLLSACNAGKGTINLDSQSVEIELNGGEGLAQITANVSGGKDSRVNVSWNGYENIIEASVSHTSSGKNTITIKGLTEYENAELVVSAAGCESKVVSVTVYSYVSSISQKVETGDKKQNYLIRGETTTLDDTKLLDLNPSTKSRRDISWSLANENDNVSIDNENNTITIGQNFEGNSILLKATNLLKSASQTDDVTCEVSLPVLDNLKTLGVNDIKVEVGYGAVGDLDENSTYDVISNANETNPHSQLNALITYTGSLKVEPIISSTDGKLDTGMLRVVENGRSAENYLQFLIHSNEDYKSLNGEFDVKFKIGYEGFDYAVELGQKIHVKVREVINEVVLADREGTSITNETTKSIYTRYALGAYGDMVRVSLKPTKVVDADYTYTLRVLIPSTQMSNFAGLEDNNFSPLTIKYKDKTNVLQELMLHNAKDANGALIAGVYEINNLSADIIYLVSADLKEGIEKIDGVMITITSDDEPSANASYNAVFTRAVSDFDGALSVYNSVTETTSTNDKDFAFALNSNQIDQTYKKLFKLVGQGSLSGLHVKSNSNLVTIQDKLVLKKFGEENGVPYIIFEVSASLNSLAYGETLQSTYEFYHDNGTNVSEELKSKLKLDVFLPLTDASLLQDTTSNSNSVVSVKYSKDDLNNGENYSSSLSSIILKNSTLTPISAVFNKTTNGKEANPVVNIRFVDLTANRENLDLTLSALLEGLADGSIQAEESSRFVRINIDNHAVKSIQTLSEGKTYAIFTFTGKAENGDEKSIQRIVKIESLVSADGLSLSQEKDRNITLYAGDTIADEDIGQTKKTIRIYLGNSNITYADANINFVFDSQNNENNKYFKVENKKVGENYIEFDVVALTTGDNAIFNGNLEMHYKVFAEEETIIDIWTTLNVTILNAQRVENVTWMNEKTDGLEFNVGDTSGQYLVFDVTPTNAKNNGLKYLPVDKDGNAQTENSFINISEISASQIAVRVNTKTKVKGSLIVYPADMVHGGNIRYYYKVAGVENVNTISLTNLGQIKENGKTWFDYLTKECYFVSYKVGTTDDGQPQRTEISFDRILKRIDIIVVDGSSFEYSYRLYSAEDFKSIEVDKYYTLKSSIVLSVGGENNAKQLAEFTGGLQGGDDISITFNKNSLNLVKTLKGTIRNLTLLGNVEGNGFVCDTNEGTIENIIIDAKGTYASVLTANGVHSGGIAGVNSGFIKNVGVLGLSINGNSTYIGGVAGKNSGNIYGARVEFYNVQTGKNENGEKLYGTNSFAGANNAIIAGIVGEAVKNSSIERCYAYDYTLIGGDNGQKNNLTAPFVGYVSTTAGEVPTETSENPKVLYSFAVVGCHSEKIADAFPSNVVYKDVYNSYYDDSTYISKIEMTDSNNFVIGGENGYKSYVNNKNEHLKDFYQDEKLATVAINAQDIKTDNGYMQVMVLENAEMVFMHYGITDIVTTLTETEQRDLDRLNTISLAKLAGNENIKVTSSNEMIVRVQGTNLVVNQTGTVRLTFSSRQDASNYVEKEITVISAYNGFKLSYGAIEDVDSTKISIQKTKSAIFTASLLKTEAYLGSLARSYELVTPSFQLESITTPTGTDSNSVRFTKSALVFTAVTDQNSVETVVRLQAKVAGIEYAHKSLKKEFTVSPEEGAISIDYTGEKLVVTPSVNGTLKVVVKTTQNDDKIIPTVIYKNSNGDIVLTRNANNGAYVFLRNNVPILNVSVVKENENTTSGENQTITTDIYTVSFSIHEKYKKQIRADEEFEVYFTTTTQNESERLKLEFNRQKFTSIDITNSVVKNAYRNDGTDTYVVGERTSTLAPGKSSIMQVSVNPEFAYYDYMEIKYSGVNIAGAVTIDRVQKNQNGYFSSINSENFEQVGNAFRYTPNAENKTQQIYFKLWINTTVEADSTLCFTVSFYGENGEELTYANYYMDISYLREPRITIDGEETVFLAKGSKSQIKIEVLSNQTLDALVVDGTVNGISIESVSDKPEIDLVKGIKTYTATIRASLKAKVNEDNIGTFYLKATVRRTLNGFEETKYAIATVILVDFKISEDDILIGEKNGDSQELTVWAGVPKTVKINYGLIPTEYPIGETDSTEAQELIKKRNEFLNAGYYPSKNVNNANYIINYRDKSVGGEKVYQKLSIKERLFYVIGGKEYALDAENLSSKAISVYEAQDKNAITITGNVMSGTSVSMVLYTYVTANNVEKMIKTYFTINIETFSDEDLPLVIKDADAFRALDPENGEKEVQDYILLNDIVLENYEPFDTTYISSLDGNGHTIYIKSFAMKEDESTLNVALFNTVLKTTMLKNVRVNLYEGGQLTVNISQYKNINVAGFALSNKGIITNCEVVAFYTNGSYTVGGQKLSYTNRLPSNKQAGINLFLTNGINTTQEAHLAENLKVSVNLAGFVLNNDGNITNSRVGGDNVYVISGEETTADGTNVGRTDAEQIRLENFIISGQGCMAGFVQKNGGTISASFVKNTDMDNRSNISKDLNGQDIYLAGFVGENSGRIVTSFIEGIPVTGTEKETAIMGSSLKSQGIIAGFAYSNISQINDSYSNILISTSQGSGNVMFASGFVYKNSGKITNGFSACQVESDKFTQMNFSGVDANSESQQTGEYENCYFYSVNNGSAENDSSATTETQYSTGAMLIADPTIVTSFYGFAVSTSADDDSGIWRIIDGKVSLIEAERISFSHRYIYYVEDSAYEGPTRVDGDKKYILPYTTLVIGGTTIDTSLGGVSNPIIIADAEDFVKAMGESSSTYIKKYFDETNVYGTYRVVNDIDLNDLTAETASYSLPSSSKSFSGRFYGNGFTIQSVRLTSSNKNVVSYGLFKSLESISKTSAEIGVGKVFKPIVTNLILKVDGVVAGDVPLVGVLAGYVKDATIVGITVDFSNNAEIVGYNFVGGIAGYAFGSSIVKNVTLNNPSTYALYYTSTGAQNLTPSTITNFRAQSVLLQNATTFDNTVVGEFRKYSYAGALFGMADICNTAQSNFDYADYQKSNYQINNIKVRGIINSKAMVVGGAIGITGPQTYVNDISVVFDGSTSFNESKLYAMFGYAGGVIGQSFGGVTRIYAEHTKDIQDSVESNMHSYYNGNAGVERGILNLFVGDEDYSQKAIGGLIGFAGSGALEISYSKINVTSPKAEYAGGVIGEVDTSIQYIAEAKIIGKITTSYLVHEVFATGDVRSDAKGKAGGIVGKTTGGTLSFLSVNAYNYFTSYDYVKGENVTLKVGTDNNLTPNYKINAFVGEVFTRSKDGAISKLSIPSSLTDYKQYVDFVQGEPIASSSEDSLTHTNSYYASYTFAGTEFYVYLMDRVNGETAYTDAEDSKSVYVISGPADFTTTESTNTQNGFLKSAVWLEDNWKHDPNELFPKIQYRTYGGSIYLDCYNVAQVFAQMRNNNVSVIVRGKTAPGVDTYANVDLTENRYRNLKAVEGFYGSIIGGLYKVTDSEDDVKIVSNRNFISSTKEGFSVSNLTVKFINESSTQGLIEINANGKSNNGLFVDGNLSSARINGLTIQLGSGVKFNNAKGNVGIVASTIENSTIGKVKVEAEKSGLGQSLLSVNETSEIGNIGLIAGKLVQSSQYSIMTASTIAVDAKQNTLITVGGTVKESVGGLFGAVIKEIGALHFTVRDVDANTQATTDKNAIEIERFINPTARINDPAKDVYLGGAIGLIKDVDEFSVAEATELIASNANIKSLSSNLYVSAVFGKVLNVTTWETKSFKGIEGKVDIKLENASSIYAGGFVGNLTMTSNATFDLNDCGSSYQVKSDSTEKDFVNAFVGGLIGLNGKDDNNSTATASEINITSVGAGIGVGKTTIKASEGAFVGGLIGKSQASLTINSNNTIEDNATDATITAKTVEFGGIIGRIESKFYLNAQGGGLITSNANVNAVNARAGGLVGFAGSNFEIMGSDAKWDEAKPAKKLLRYDGQITSNSKEIAFGGMVGENVQTNKNDVTFESKNTSFGGALFVKGSNSNQGKVYSGGVVGHSKATTIKISNSYNYGDVFVEYGEKLITELDEYYFGGIVGMQEGSAQVNATKNYSLMTSHNSRYSTATMSTAHALIGVGEISESEQNENYYNHKVCLITDEQATDVGYTKPYTKYYRGYQDSQSNITLAESDGEIFKVVETRSLEDYYSSMVGSKLCPSHFSDGIAKKDLYQGNTNGIDYASIENITGDLSKGIYQTDNAGQPVMDQYGKLPFYNYALIYENNKEITFTSIDRGDYGLINKLTGYSFVSGFIVENNRVIENATPYEPNKNTSYGGLVGEGAINTIIYASQVRGTIEVGGTWAVAVAGLVGRTSGKVFDCSTDINLLYRAGKGGWVSGLVCQVGKDAGAFVENCYTGGKITTYISTNCFAIGEVNNKTAPFPTKYQNCYSYTHFDLNDYTSGSFNEGKTVCLIGGEKTQDNIFYDRNACERELGGESETEPFPYDSSVAIWTKNDESEGYQWSTEGFLSMASGKKEQIAWSEAYKNIKWQTDYRYNYGYPTLKYGYLKNSSFAYIQYYNDVKQQGDATEISYDSFVFDIKYSDYKNGFIGHDSVKKSCTSSNNRLFYKIPNATVLYKAINLKIDDNQNNINIDFSTASFILTNDIDLSNSGLKFGQTDFNGTLDGQGYTIKGLQQSLFNSIKNNKIINYPDGGDSYIYRIDMPIDDDYLFTTYSISITPTIYHKMYDTFVLNLRLTDAHLTGGGGLLAGTISNAFISNMTLSGNIEIKQGDVTVGGLTNHFDGGHVACVTNLTMVTTNQSSEGNGNVHIGGLVGVIGTGNSTMSYCSNYGPINASSQMYNYHVLAGGLVGYIGINSNVLIEYSYNATSVLSGYAQPGATALETSNNKYFAAGIVARSDGTITINNCYNSGLIKAGNKSQTQGAYAAGIIADGSDKATLNSCYNEGSIEALGQNPSYSIQNDDRKLILTETGRENVTAYSIAFDVKSIKNSQNEGTSAHNGALGIKSQLASSNSISTQVLSSITSNGGYGSDAEGSQEETFGQWLSLVGYRNETQSSVDVTRHTELGDRFVILAENEFGLPTRIAYQTKTSVTFDIYRNEVDDKNNVEDYKARATTTKTFDDSLDVVFSYNYVADYNNQISSSISNQESSITLNDLKKSCRSGQVFEAKSTFIGGEEFHEISSNNAEDILNAGDGISIILKQDVTLNSGNSIYDRVEKLFGNGYYISFYNGPMLADGGNELSNVVLLGETYTNFLSKIYSLNNVSLYGFSKSNKSTEFSLVETVQGNQKVQLTSYVCVEKDYAGNQDIKLVGDRIRGSKSLKNYGTIIGKRGTDAQLNTISISGQSIDFGEGSENNGVVKAGDGGNGLVRNKTLTSIGLSVAHVPHSEKGDPQNQLVPTLYPNFNPESRKPEGAAGNTALGIKGQSGRNYNPISTIFNVGALVLGFRYDYGKNNTYQEPVLTLIPPQLENTTISVDTLGFSHDNKAYMPAKRDSYQMYIALAMPVAKEGWRSPFVHKEKAKYKKGWWFDFRDDVMNYIVQSAKLGDNVCSLNTTYSV